MGNETRGNEATARPAQGHVHKQDTSEGALASLPQGVHPDPAAEGQLLQILKDLPPDRAWWVSHLVVRYQDAQFQMSQLPPSGCRPDEDIETAIRIPEAVRRAAARAE